MYFALFELAVIQERMQNENAQSPHTILGIFLYTSLINLEYLSNL